MGLGMNKKIILGLFMSTVFAVALACGAAEVTPRAPAAAPAVAPAPAPAAAAPVRQAPQQPAAPAPAAPAAAPAAAPVAGPAPVAKTQPKSRTIETKAVVSTGATFWSDLAAQCGKRGGHLRMGQRVTEFTNLNPPTINQVVRACISTEYDIFRFPELFNSTLFRAKRIFGNAPGDHLETTVKSHLSTSPTRAKVRRGRLMKP